MIEHLTGSRTVWRITRIEPLMPRLDVTLSIDTTATPVVTAIEHAASRAGVWLERIEPELEEAR